MKSTKTPAWLRNIHLLLFLSILVFFSGCNRNSSENLKLNSLGYYEKQGLNVLVFSNWYDAGFDDSKMSGIEIIHHDVRTVTNGDVRLSPTPGQWDPIPVFGERTVDTADQSIRVMLSYPGYDFNYMIKAKPEKDGVIISVILDKKLPSALEGKAGFNLEFLPSAYFGKTYLMDGLGGNFPLYPSSNMTIAEGESQPLPMAKGKKLVLAPDDPMRFITVETETGELMLYDGRNKAQNGWYVARTLIPAEKAGEVIRWKVSANAIRGWVRKPVIGHSQVGYHPGQKKISVIETDPQDKPVSKAKLIKVREDGTFKYVFSGDVKKWGKYLRYQYYTFDFSQIKEEGIYIIEYKHHRTDPFRIAKDVYGNAWHPTLDVFLPVQMDHMFVNEAYRVWHGAAHLDDALQAPVNHIHFDLYAQGPTTDSPYKPGEHIPGLNVGGWFDAGDFDIRTSTQCFTVLNLVYIWELFRPERDNTYIDQKTKYVDIHYPDGKPDILQQVEHGVLALIAQQKAVGHAINGIIVPTLAQYTHLGDALTMTDNLVYNPRLDSLETDGFTSGTFDDRWAFTNASTALNYSSAATLAASCRALKDYNSKLAEECLSHAIRIWNEEHSHAPDTFKHGNTTGGDYKVEEIRAALELLITTGEEKYLKRLKETWPVIEKNLDRHAGMAVRALPYLDSTYMERMRSIATVYRDTADSYFKKNPYGVPVSEGGWAGNGLVVFFGTNNYWLHKTFPDIIGPEYVFRSLNYLYGCHPGSDISFVSAVGTRSKQVAYGNNRADFSFIAGGIVPGVLILPPDYPENKEDWPFLWGENEYVVALGPAYMFLVLAATDICNELERKDLQ